jgi:DNA polymerase-3 subunit delta'
MTAIDEIRGQDAPIKLLRRCLRDHRLPHALLFQGPEGVGKRTVALWLAKSLLCEMGPADAPCGTCDGCLRFDSGNHPDFFLVTRQPKKPDSADEPEEDDEAPGPREKAGSLRPFIVIEQIRDIVQHSSYAPRQGPCRVFVVEPADRMNPAAQNALLKTLEEPGSRAVLILVSARPHVLLPTVRSRSFVVPFAPVPPEQLADLLRSRGFSKEDARARAVLSGGRAGRALELDLVSHVALRDALLSDLERLTAPRPAIGEMPSMAARLAGDGEDDVLDRLELLEEILRDVARADLGSPTLLHADRGDRIAKLGRALTPGRRAALLERVERLRHEVRIFHTNRTLLAESILAAVAGGPLP